MLPIEAPSSACQQACQELLILPNGLLKRNKYWEEFYMICIPGVLFNSLKESLKGHNETCARREKQSYVGTSHPLPQHQTPCLEGSEHPLPNTTSQTQDGAGKHLAASAAARYLFLHSQFAFLDRKGVMREQGVKILLGNKGMSSWTRQYNNLTNLYQKGLTHWDTGERTFGPKEKPGFLERTEREVSGKERDEFGRKVRFVVCCASEIHGFLRPERDNFTSCSVALLRHFHQPFRDTPPAAAAVLPCPAEHRTPTHINTHTHLSKQV